MSETEGTPAECGACDDMDSMVGPVRLIRMLESVGLDFQVTFSHAEHGRMSISLADDQAEKLAQLIRVVDTVPSSLPVVSPSGGGCCRERAVGVAEEVDLELLAGRPTSSSCGVSKTKGQ